MMTTHHQYLNGVGVAAGCSDFGWLFERRILSLEAKEGRDFPNPIQKKLEMSW